MNGLISCMTIGKKVQCRNKLSNQSVLQFIIDNLMTAGFKLTLTSTALKAMLSRKQMCLLDDRAPMHISAPGGRYNTP